MTEQKFIVAMDFDGTIFGDKFPDTGPPNMAVIEKIKEFQRNNCEVVLWTCREGAFLVDAVEKSKSVGLIFDAVNENAPSQVAHMKEMLLLHGEKSYGEFATRKIYANVYVDDKAPGSIDFFLRINVPATCDNFRKRHGYDKETTN